MSVSARKTAPPTGRGVYERIREALVDGQLRRSVRRTTDRFQGAKERAYAEMADLDGLRDRARAIRSHTVANLDHYLGLLSERARANGMHVHFARTGEDATRYVARVIQAQQARLVAKSKSMISEELHLNDALAHLGVEVVETDLGEYIIQLAGETPSHIIAPALHKNRSQVADLFSNQAQTRIPSDTPTLTAYARQRLREVFLRADVGITGCNFAVAETGSVCLVTNEGNGRMVTSLPRVQIVLMGMERVVPTLADLDVMLHLLPRAATGQKVTSYVTLCSGPRREGELDGPEEMHLVVVDNGRSNLLGGEFQEALNCIRCGACLNVCPVYRQVGGHAYGWVYPGPIGAVITPLYKGVDEWGDLANATSLCGACTETCPVKIPLHDMLIGLRRAQIEQGGQSGRSDRGEQMFATRVQHAVERLVFRGWAAVMTRPTLFRWSLRLGRLAQRPFVKDGFVQGSIPILKEWTKSRELPGLAPTSFRERWVAKGGEFDHDA